MHDKKGSLASLFSCLAGDTGISLPQELAYTGIQTISRKVCAMRMQIGIALLVLVQLPAGAAEVYVCDTPQGREYRNTDIGQGCRRADLPGLTIVGSGSAAPVATAVDPSTIVVDGVVPGRDVQQVQALEQQLHAEEQRLAGLRQAYNDGQPERQGDERNYAKYQERVVTMQEELSRVQGRVDALKRELGR